MDKLASLCKRRGFIFQSSEIYGGLGSVWDYGPLGVLIKNNVKAAWWKAMVQERDDIVGLDASILMHAKVWEASGHVAGFADPLVDCKQCKQRFRADHVWMGYVAGRSDVKPVSVVAASEAGADEQIAPLMRKAAGKDAAYTKVPLEKAEHITRSAAPCPACGATGSLTEARMFNLMFKTFVGPVENDASLVYLRPETAQGIFVNFDSVLTTTRKKLPFGIAQTGKAFRNEITTGNFIYRDREFEQMELEYFVKPGTDEQWYRHWVQARLDWWTSHGLRRESLRLREHGKDELSHYSKGTTDIEFKFPWDWGELEGIANRTSFDLDQHTKFSGKALKYFDDETKESYVPYVIEPSSGVDRGVLAFLSDAYAEEQDKDEIRTVLKLHPAIAPVKVAVLPLSKKEPLVNLAREVWGGLRKHWFTQYDDAQSIGRRYRRQDEIGTPLCVTVDFESLEDKQVTIRERDAMTQVRVPIAELVPALRDKLGF
jgi:glycyl-tRNA synthetase